jgi:GH24 family phage-related lysozyme (muramidase)
VTVPQAAIELAKRFEGFERRVKRGTEITAIPYVCPAGFWTIGYGHLCAPDHLPISLEEAEAYLALDLVKALNATGEGLARTCGTSRSRDKSAQEIGLNVQRFPNLCPFQ